MSLSETLLKIIVCPGCKGALEYRDDENRLICSACQLAYPISDDIPVLLADESEKL